MLKIDFPDNLSTSRSTLECFRRNDYKLEGVERREIKFFKNTSLSKKGSAIQTGIELHCTLFETSDRKNFMRRLGELYEKDFYKVEYSYLNQISPLTYPLCNDYEHEHFDESALGDDGNWYNLTAKMNYNTEFLHFLYALTCLLDTCFFDDYCQSLDECIDNRYCPLSSCFILRDYDYDAAQEKLDIIPLHKLDCITVIPGFGDHRTIVDRRDACLRQTPGDRLSALKEEFSKAADWDQSLEQILICWTEERIEKYRQKSPLNGTERLSDTIVEERFGYYHHFLGSWTYETSHLRTIGFCTTRPSVVSKNPAFLARLMRISAVRHNFWRESLIQYFDVVKA